MKRIIILILGAIFCVLPCIEPEIGSIYYLSPWIWLLCFLFYTRTMEKKTEWLIFTGIFLIAYEIRYRNFMGDSSFYYIIVSAIILTFGQERIPINSSVFLRICVIDVCRAVQRNALHSNLVLIKILIDIQTQKFFYRIFMRVNPLRYERIKIIHGQFRRALGAGCSLNRFMDSFPV